MEVVLSLNLGMKMDKSKQLLIYQKLPLKQKIEISIAKIKEFYEAMDSQTYVSFSGGKDSTVLLHLVRSIYPSVKAVWGNTTNEDVDVIKFVKTIDNVDVVIPKMNFVKVVENYGFPLVSKMVARQIKDFKNPTQANAKTRNLWLTGISGTGKESRNKKLSEKWKFLIDEPFDITSKCCDILKKEPLARYEKQTGLKPFIGVMAAEGGQRANNIVKYGCNIIDSDSPKSRPLSFWTEKDIWAYAELHNIRFAECYYDRTVNGQFLAAEQRTGCTFCGFGYQFENNSLFESDRFTKQKIKNPARYKKIMQLKNNGITFEAALEKIAKDTVR